MRRTLKAFFALLASVAFLSASAAHAQEARLTDDARVSSGQPNTNFNAGNAGLNLQILSGTDRSFLKFDLSTLPTGTTGNNVAKAVLRTWVNTLTTAGSINVVRVTGAWAEGTITNANAPALGANAATAVPVTGTNSFVTVDVTALVRDWLNGVLPNNGLALVGNAAGTSVRLDSKENTLTSHEPVLEITLPGSTGQPGTFATLGPNNFTGDQKITGSLDLSTSNITGVSATTTNSSFFAAGVRGLATAATGVTRGVFGEATSPNGIGVHGIGGIGGQFESGTGAIIRGRGLGHDRFTLAANGDMSNTGNLSTGGNLRVEGGVSVGGAATVAVDAPGVAGGRMTITPAGDVAIGSNIPLAKLDVAGNLLVRGRLEIGTEYIESAAVTVAPHSKGTAVAICPGGGTKVLAGGISIGGPSAEDSKILEMTWPNSKDRWVVRIANFGNNNISLIATAVCGRIPLN